MNIIIVGCGKVGEKLAEQLCNEQEHNITIVDLKQDIVNSTTSNYDAMGIIGSGINVEALLEAGIKDADLTIAVTGSDELNLIVSLMAKKLGNCQTIARVRQPEYMKSLHFIKEELGLAMVINPEQAAASEIARILRFPSAIEIDTFAKGRVEILKFLIEDGSVLHDIRVKDIVSKLNCDILICGVERDGEVYIPHGDFVLKSGDYISIVASIHNGEQFFKKIGIKTNRVKETMIIGGSGTAYYLANQLIQNGIDVKIIEKNLDRCEELCQLLPKATIIHGDGTDHRLLLEEGLEQSESVVTMTNIDEENILLSMYAKSKTDGKIVTKINRIAYDEVIGELDLGTIIYPKNITAEYIIRFVRAKHNSVSSSDIETMHLILNDKAEALEFKVKEGSPISNIKIEDLKLKRNILISCIARKGEIIIPRGKDIIKTGDSVIVVTLKSGFSSIDDILE
jgi:trk system potassium uptake protein TrkA